MTLPIGSIITWNDNLIPQGWAVCDGDNGTPDLRDKFIYGAENDLALREEGGSETHIHENEGTEAVVNHNHNSPFLTSVSGGASIAAHTEGTHGSSATVENHTHSVSLDIDPAGEHSHTIGDTDSASHIPEYIKRIYIKRVA